MTWYLGIDPGRKGGFAQLNPNASTAIAAALPLPFAGKQLDGYTLARWVRSLPRDECIAVVELAQAMPKQGGVSMFTYGTGYGTILGVLTALGVRTELVRPTEWKRVVLAGTDKDKAAAVSYCRRAFPAVGLVPDGKRNPHDGMADALCLAEYGRRTYAQAK